MTRTSLVVGLFALVAACNKPTDESCRKAISNMRTLIGTDSSNQEIEGDVRRCKGGSSKKAVECAAKATTLDELRKCDFMKIPAKAGGTPATFDPASDATGSANGSAAGSAPNAAGSDSSGATGSGAAGSAEHTGSADPGAAGGSGAAGSGAAEGSADTGSASK